MLLTGPGIRQGLRKCLMNERKTRTETQISRSWARLTGSQCRGSRGEGALASVFRVISLSISGLSVIYSLLDGLEDPSGSAAGAGQGLDVTGLGWGP